MTQGKFIERVIQEITFGGKIPNKINGERLNNIISNSVRKFRDKDDRSTLQHHLILPVSLFETEYFRQTRKVKIADCVKAVTDLKISNRQYLAWNGNVDSDFNKLGTVSGQFLGGTGVSILQAVATASYYDFAQTLNLQTVSYDFDEYSHQLVILGSNPRYDLIAEVFSYICEEAMYEMSSFFDYVCGKCYEDYAIVTGFTKLKLLNDYEINVSEIKSKGKELIDDVKKEWDEQLGESDFIVLFD